MTQASDIVTKALQEIGAHSPFNAAPPESRTLAHEYLIDLLEEWEAERVVTGIRVPENNDQNADINEPEDGRQAVILSLAVRLAGPLQKEITEGLLMRQHEREKRLFRIYRYREPPDRDVPFVSGEGNWLR